MVEGAAATITVLATKYSKFQTGQVNFKGRVFNTHPGVNRGDIYTSMCMKTCPDFVTFYKFLSMSSLRGVESS